MPPIPASSSSTATATTRTAEAQAAFQERFYNVYHSLIASGMSHVDSAAKALLVAGGQATTEEFNNTSPSTNPHESCPATTGAAGAGVAGAAAPAAAAAAAAAGAAVGVSQAAGSSQAAADVVPQGAALPEGAALLGVGQACDAATEGANATASARSVVEYQSSTAHQSSALFQSVPPESSRQTAVPSADSDGDASLKDRGSNKSRGSSSAEMGQNEPQEQQQRQEKAERTGRNEPRATAAVAPPPAPPQELIRAGRLLELIEIERATGGGNFRELIRFLGRTMSNPACVGASFALPRPRDSVGENARAGNESSGGGNDSGGVSSPNNPEASRGQKSSVSDLSHDAEKASVAAEELESVLKSGSGRDGRCDGEGGGAERGSTSVSGERAGGAVHDDRERQFSSTEDIAIATRPLPLGRADHASAGVSAGAEEKFVAEVTSTVTTRNDRKAVDRTEGEEKTSPEREKWVDRSAVAMDVQAATDVWRVLRELDVEGVTGAVLNALESLTQTLLMDKILDGGRGEAHGWIDHGAVSSAGDEEGNRGYGDRAGLRSVVLVLEHPEIQDPDFESVLNSLFKLSMRLSESSREELCNFFAGLEVDRFSRYLGAVQQFISLRIYSGGGASSVLVGVHFVHLLYLANQDHPKVDDEMFYNEAVNSELFTHRPSLIDDYSRWREDHSETNPARYKSLISFGEVLDPASKAAVLGVDSQVQMRGTITNELQEAVMSSGFSDGALTVMPYLLLKVRRSNIVEDSLHTLAAVSDEELKKPLKVHFVGEEGIDEGGVQKEYFQVMLRELLNPEYAMLKYDEETRNLWFNSDSLESQEEFELVGMLLGIAIYNGVILDVRFPSVVYKLLMGKDPTLEDLKEAQPSLGKGLQQLLDFDGDVEETFDRTFQISYEVFGAVKTFDLKEEGGSETVTKDNRREYVDLYMHWLLVKSVQEQFGPFERGFHKVVGGKALSLFRPEELELLICGNPQLDFLALENNSQYEDGYKRDTPVIKNFWEVVHAFDDESKRKLLKFATGSDRAPIAGLGSSGLSLVISKNGDDSDRLPTAHTCFNHLLLPAYATKEKLEGRLRLAIDQSEGFGLR